MPRKPTYEELEKRIRQLEQADLKHTQTRVALQERLQQYRSIVDHLPVLICSYIPMGEITFVNHAYCDYFNKKPDELIGSNFLSLIPETDRETVIANISALSPQSPTQLHEHRVIAPDGEIRWQQWTNRALFDEEGNVVQYQSIGQDITNSRQTESKLKDVLGELRQNEERLQIIFDNAPTIMLLINEDTEVIKMNQVGLSATEKFFDDIKGVRGGDVLNCVGAYQHPDGCGFGDDCQDCKIRQTVEATFSNNQSFNSVETQLTTKQNDKIITHTVLISSVIVNQNPPKTALITIDDITDRKKAEEELRDSEKNYRSIFDAANDALFIHHIDTGEILSVNQKMCDMYGYSKAEALTLSFEAISDGKAPYTEKDALEWIDKAVRGNPQLFEWRARDKAGRLFWVEVNLKRAVIGGEKRLLSIVRDISERKMAENALKENERRYRLLADNVTDVIWLLGLDLKFTYVSPSIEKQRGYTPEEAVQIPLEQTFTPESYQKVVQTFTEEMHREQKAGVDPNRSVVVELDTLRKDGSALSTEVNASFLRDKTGSPTGIIGVTRDISDRKHAEKALRESEEKYRRIFDNSLVGFFQSAPEGRFISANPALATMLGYDSPEDLIATITDIATQFYLNPDDRMRYQKALSNQGQVDSFEFRARRRDGSEIWMQTSSRAYFNNDGTVSYYEGVVSDITERKIAEKALGDSEARLSQIIMGNPVPTFVVDNNHVTTHWNMALEDVTGISAEDIIGTNKQWMAFYSEERPVMADLIADNVAENEIKRYYNGKLLKSNGAQNAYIAEDFFPDMGKNGRWLLFTAAPIRNFDGEITGAVETLQDITDRKQFEQSLFESELRYRSLYESANDAIFILKDGRVLDCNPKTLAIFNCTADQLIGRYPHELSPEFQPNGTSSKDLSLVYQRMAHTEEHQFFYWQHRRHDGSLFDAEVNLAQFEIGGVRHLLAIIRDITDRIETEKKLKEMEKQLLHSRKIEAIGTLAGGIAHDFNNILAAMIGYTELLQMNLQESSTEYEFASQIQRAGNRAKELVQQILTFSRQTELEYKPVEMTTIVEEVAKLLRSSLPSTIQIEKIIQSDAIVMGDSTQLHQVLMNLCTNAGHAMKEAGGLLKIALKDIEVPTETDKGRIELQPGRHVVLMISDTGHGMSPEIIARIFDPYFTTKEKDEGTGMGLSVVHGIVESHDGAILVDSKTGKGSTFKIYLPAIGEQTDIGKHQADEIPTGDERILFVDDEQILVELTTAQLEALGYRVSSRSSSIEALALFKNKPESFDLVITDLTMPKVTGDALAKEIKRINPKMPVVLCTGFSTKITPENARQFGIDAFVMKPIVVKELATIIRTVLGER